MLIAGPNLTIDRTLTIDELRPGEVLRFDDVVVTPGGKGVNVARVARALDAPALLVGFTPDEPDRQRRGCSPTRGWTSRRSRSGESCGRPRSCSNVAAA
jgi:hypothetical protein